ncbi:MAG: ubiquitin-like protein Pup [Patescibacteria group bacterium]
MSQEKKDKKPHETPQHEETEQKPKVSKTAEEMKAEVDNLIDEIDDTLEVDAEEFVKNYVQKGGE